MRPPSLGFTYLLIAAAAFAAFFMYLSRPMWWQDEDLRARDLAQSDYLVRIARDGPEKRRKAWLTDAMRLAGLQASWDRCEKIFDLAEAKEITLRNDVLRELHEGMCWAIALDANNCTKGPGTAALLVRNNKPQPVTLQTFWSATRKGTIEHRIDGGEWQTQPLKPNVEIQVELTLAGNSRMRLEVRGAESMFPKKYLKRRPGVRLARIQVKP